MKLTVVRLAFTLGALVGVLRAQETPAEAAASPVVELPKFVVTDNRELPPPESWRYATIPGFEVLTNASDKATQRLISDFAQFRQALGYVWPMPDRLTHSTSLIICGRGNKFDTFVPKGDTTVDVGQASLFLRQGTRAAIVIDLQATTLNLLNVDNSEDAATGTDSGLMSVEHDKQLYREYVRYLLSQSEPRTPAWLEEGLAQIIMRMQWDRRRIEVARLEDPNTISAQAGVVAAFNAISVTEDADSPTLPGAPAEDRDFNVALRRRALVPLERFFAVPHNAVEATNPLGNNVWAKQAYAFVHMCLYGYHGKYQKPFTTFLQRLAKEPVSEVMFKECFKMSYKDMLFELRSYSEMTVYQSKGFQSTKGGPDLITKPEPLVFRDATQAEVGRIKGEALLIAGHKAAARAELIAPYTRGERDPNLLAAIGLYEKTTGEEQRARKFLEAAFKEKSKRPDANLELARLRFADAIAQPAAPDKRLSSAQVAAVFEPLLVARQTPPPMPALYELAAETLARGADAPKRDEAMVVIEGAQVFPTRFRLVYQAAASAAEIGETQAAHALVDHGLKYAPDEKAKAVFAKLKAALPPAPAAPPSAAPAAAKAAAGAR